MQQVQLSITPYKNNDTEYPVQSVRLEYRKDNEGKVTFEIVDSNYDTRNTVFELDLDELITAVDILKSCKKY